MKVRFANRYCLYHNAFAAEGAIDKDHIWGKRRLQSDENQGCQGNRYAQPLARPQRFFKNKPGQQHG